MFLLEVTFLRSQQEPRLLSFYSQDDDMINNYKNNRDLYALIGSRVYHNKYEDNLEFVNGVRSEDGAKRRSNMKTLLLGIMYGMSPNGIANKIGCDTKEAEGILNDFYDGFPKVRKWTDETIASAHKCGYVKDWYGRRRRLPTLLVPKFTIKLLNNDKEANFNPFIGCANREIDDETLNKYQEKLDRAKWYKDIKAIKDQAFAEGVSIVNNNVLINRAERQCVNARIQGGAATMTKVAMIKIYNDEEMQRLGFKLLIGVHDELIGECPEENAQKCADRLSYLMKTCIEDKCNVPFKCDASIVKRWYEDVYQSSLEKELNDYMDKGKLSKEDAFDKLVEEHQESTKEYLKTLLGV